MASPSQDSEVQHGLTLQPSPPGAYMCLSDGPLKMACANCSHSKSEKSESPSSLQQQVEH